MQVISRLRNTLSGTLSVLQIFERPTIAALAETILQGTSANGATHPADDPAAIEEGVL